MNKNASASARHKPEIPMESEPICDKDTILSWQTESGAGQIQTAEEYLESLKREKRSEALGVFCFIFAPSLLIAWSEMGDAFLAFPLFYLLALVACGVYLCMSSDGIKKKNRQFKKSRGYLSILPALLNSMDQQADHWKNLSTLGVFLLCLSPAPVVFLSMLDFMITVGVACTLLMIAIGVGLECYGSGMLSQKKKVLKKLKKSRF